MSIVSWLSVTGFLTVIKFAVELKARVVLTSLLFLVIIILAWSFTVVVYITARSTRKQISAIISSITLHLQKKQSDSGAKMLELQNRKARLKEVIKQALAITALMAFNFLIYICAFTLHLFL